MKENKIVRIALAGGLIGLLATNPRRALERTIEAHNREGWTCIYFTSHATTNALIFILQILVLLLTLGLWTWGAGYMVLFVRDAD